jgi:hypothetical protein
MRNQTATAFAIFVFAGIWEMACTSGRVTKPIFAQVEFSQLAVDDTVLAVIQAQLTDIERGLPVESSIFYFKNKDTTLNYSFRNRDGNYTVFVPPDVYKIYVGALGYQRVDVGIEELKSGYIYRLDAQMIQVLMSK